LEERVFDAVLDIYGRKGWTGLSIAEAAAQAKVGKSSIYLRWPDKQGLLIAALQHHQFSMAEMDPADSIRAFLITHALRRAESYLGRHGLAFIRLHVEARAFPEESEEVRRQTLTRSALLQRERMHQAMGLTDGGSAAVTQILDTLEGAVLMHVLVTPPELEDRVRTRLPAYVGELVDTLLTRWPLS
jgi:AcrR family transcriptional regulator